MLHILLFGASGRTGELFVEEALKRGHRITALVRKPESMKARPNLTLVKGTPCEEAEVRAAFASAPAESPITAVASALGNNLSSDSLLAKVVNPPDIMENSMRNIISAMAAQSPPVRKIVFLSSFAVGNARPHASIFVRQIIKWTNLGVSFADHDKVDEMLKTGLGKDLDWTLVRAASLNDKPAGPIKEMGELPKGVGLKQISRASTAVFMVDAIEKNDWVRKTPVIINA